MSRQINLYSLEFRPQVLKFSAAWTLAAVLVVAAAMAAEYAWESSQLRGLRAQRASTASQVKQLRAQLITLGREKVRKPDKVLEQRVVRTESLLRSRQEVAASLSSGRIGNQKGFARFLTALARERLPGVWLTHIEISGPDSDFAIKGRTVRADLIPEYIRLLRNEQVFKGRSISTLAMHAREIEPQNDGQVPVDREAPAAAAANERASPPPSKERPRGVRVVEFTLGSGSAAGSRAAKGATR